MLSPSILSLLCAVGTLAGPVLNQRDMEPHPHNHMDFHSHQARDTGADEMLNWLESNAPSGDFPGSNETPNNPPKNAPPVVEKVVEAPIVYTTVTVDAGAPPAFTPPTSSPAPPPKHTNPPVREKISGPPVAQQGQPNQQPPQQSSAPSNPPSDGLPSAPTDYIESLTSEDQAYKNLVLVHHNIHRANHSVPGLVWNDTLYEIAKASAQACRYEHTSPTPPYGQNIAAGNAPGNVSADISNGFYNGEIGLFLAANGDFGNNSPDMNDFEHWGHATQMLWKTTTSVACYTAVCSPPGADPLACNPSTGESYLPPLNCNKPGLIGTRAFFLVCNYYPPGNYPDSYSAVRAPNGGRPFVQMTEKGVTGL